MKNTAFDLLQNFSVHDLLNLHAGIMNELRSRKIIRSGNNPVGDYAELLFARAFSWNLENNSSAGYDATDKNGIRFQIKCRRVTKRNPSRQLSALRNLSSNPFDTLAAVLLDENFGVLRAVLVPIAVVLDHSTYTQHVHAHRFLLRDAVWSLPGVMDVTGPLMEAQRAV